MRKIISIISVIFVVLTISSCDVCQTAIDMETEEYKIKIYGKSKDYDDLKPESYWVSSRMFVNKLTSSGTVDNPRVSMDIGVDSNDLDLCFSDHSDYYLFPDGITIGNTLSVLKDDLIYIYPIKEKIVINDCSNPPTHVHVHDLEKCKNGYTKKDNSAQFVERAEGKVFEVESYIIDNINGMYNVISPNKNVLPGKKLVIPQEYELEDKGVISYSFLPDIPDAHKTQLENYKRSSGKDFSIIASEYWCRKLPLLYSLLIPTNNVNGFELNKFCDGFYKFDTIENTLIDDMYYSVDKSRSDVAICPNFNDASSIISSSRTKGNTDAPNRFLYSFIENGCVEDFEIDNKTISFYISRSKFLYQLALGFKNKSSMTAFLNDTYNDPLNISGKMFGKFDGLGLPQLPLEKSILIPDDGTVRPFGIFPLALPSGGNNNGFYRFSIKRSCKAKKLYAYFSEDGAPPQIRPNDLVLNPDMNVMSFDLLEQDQNGEYVNTDKISIDLTTIPRDGWVYFAIADNGDGYENNSGLLNLSVKRPKDKKDNFFNKFLNKVIDNIESILFGNTPAKNNGVATILYQKIVKSQFFREIINIFLLIFITSYGIMIVAGLTQFQASDLTKTALKIGFVYALLMPQSWKFFNEYLFDIFIRGPDQLLMLILTPSGQSVDLNGNRSLVFGTVSEILSRISDVSFFKQLISLLFAGPFGWIALIIILISFCWLIYASFSAFLIYIISMTLISIFLSVSPLFIMTLLFKYTNKIFKAWFKVLISNVMTLLFTFVGLYTLGTIAALLLDDIFSFGICTRCALIYNLGPFEICMMYAAMPDQFPELYSYEQLQMIQEANSSYNTGTNSFYGLPIGINKLLALYIVSYILRKSVDVFSQLANEVSDIGFGGPGGAGGIASAVENNFKYWFGVDKRMALKDATKTKKAKVELTDDGKQTEKNDDGDEKKTVNRK